jgi:putative iron-only hydrogenase system regulator
MGVPYQARQVSVIALIVDGTTDEIGAMTGKLGNIPGVTVKTVLTPR